MTPNSSSPPSRPQARNEPDSGIVKAAMYGFTVPGVIPLWAGEGNLPTPEAFARPAAEALLGGETFYTWQRGIPELREALARYHERTFGRGFSPENFFVTSGGMQAIQTIVQMIAGEGDEIVIPTPGLAQLWRHAAHPGLAPRRGADGLPQRPLDARSRPAVRRGHAAHQGHLAQLALQSGGLDGDAARS